MAFDKALEDGIGELKVTLDHSKFEKNELNRPFQEKPSLLESMKKYGFMRSGAIQVIRSKDHPGKLVIIRGHHRFEYAKRLNIPVWYIIDETNSDIFSLEEDTSQTWNINDHVMSHFNAGHPAYITLVEFRRKHRLTLTDAISLVGGESAGSANKNRAAKKGTFSTGDMTHANQVVAITDELLSLGFKFSTQSIFVQAISKAVRVPEFDGELFCHRCQMQPGMLIKQNTLIKTLDMMEAIYNHGAKTKRLALAFRAIEVSTSRANFGRR